MAKHQGGNINFQDVAETIGAKASINPIAVELNILPRVREALEIRSRQQFLERYKWITLSGQPFPEGIDPVLMERILYYRYWLMVFKYKDGKFYTTPLVLNGNIDVYGRYTAVSPLVFNGATNVAEDGTPQDNGDGQWITDERYAPSYSLYDVEPTERNGEMLDRCVILRDYTNGIMEYGKPRNTISKVYDELLAETVGLIEHNLVASSKVYTFRVTDEGQKETAMRELGDVRNNILNLGQIFMPIVSPVELDELFASAKVETQELWESYVSMDNLRENLIGIENNGIFKKKERELKGEQELEASSGDLVYADGLKERQRFCEIFNAMFGTDLWCIESETINKVDLNQGEEEDGMGEEQNIQ